MKLQVMEQTIRRHEFSILLSLLVIVGGCSTLARRPVPESLADSVCVPHMPCEIRTWGNQRSEMLQRSLQESFAQTQHAYGDHEPMDILSISSGGLQGAYAAGVLCGWTEHGTRPVFRVVSGVSIGAIIAPFAFLGSGFDDRLYGKFISECSRLFVDSLVNKLDRPEAMLPVYALLNRVRVSASDAVLAEAEQLLKRITEQYFSPNLSVEELHALVNAGSDVDPLKPLGNACRDELKSMRSAV